MNRAELEKQIARKKSVLCVGLDTDLDKIPSHLLDLEDPIFEFNKAIIDATADYAVAYKPNMAFYEAEGLAGWQSLEKTIAYLNQNYPDIFTIADAKRGDIGNTSARYARAFFEKLAFDAVTVAPYMGQDSVTPFLGFENKWVILLALTSNMGSADFQSQVLYGGQQVFEQVLKLAQQWASDQQLMFVVGATKAGYFKRIRDIAPNNFLLVPGVGAQGGDLNEVMKFGQGKTSAALLINSSRGIIYKSSNKNFAEIARKEAKSLRDQMQIYL